MRLLITFVLVYFLFSSIHKYYYFPLYFPIEFYNETSYYFFKWKELIGRKYSDPVIQKEKMLWPFKVVAGINDKPMIVVKYKGQEKHLCAEEVSSMVFT